MIAGVIFDMDGLLIDSEPLWRIAEVEALSAVGVPIDDDAARATTGLRTDEVVEQWHARFPWADPPKSTVAGQIVARVVELLRERGEPMPGARETLAALTDAGLPLAIASSSQGEVIATVLDVLGLAGAFRVVQSAEHEPYGKPHPGVYIEAARRLGLPPTQCLAFEDSPNGVIAAKSARMTCIAVPDPALTADRRFCAADLILPSLTDFRIELLREL
jgi:mannitol-1-/sugar-/sorbitol-6-/2-deoxyglucose-6-phosphatase